MTRLRSGIFTAITSVKSPPLLNTRACSCSSCAPSARWEGGCEDTGVEDPRAPARGCLHPRLVPDLESLEPHTDRLACNLVGPVQREQANIFQYPQTDRLACNLIATVAAGKTHIFQYPHTDRFACNGTAWPGGTAQI